MNYKNIQQKKQTTGQTKRLYACKSLELRV